MLIDEKSNNDLAYAVHFKIVVSDIDYFFSFFFFTIFIAIRFYKLDVSIFMLHRSYLWIKISIFHLSFCNAKLGKEKIVTDMIQC